MCCMPYFVMLFIGIANLTMKGDCRFEFTNVNCSSFDKKFGEFEYCFLKSVNRSYKYFSAKLQLYQLPISIIKINLVMWKRYNGYKPFLYNITVDFCKFINNRKSNPVANFVFESYQRYSNLNHSCPFNHDLIMEKLSIDIMNHRMTKILPFPEGDYLFETTWFRSRVRTFVMKIYGTLS
ncbi:uncharacterized protein [Drosophila bipectinata]|uniref:uncharacterized protein n=1 Tax=Drosophila bipectinata TaxID=42026 RepID=UPI0007E62262|nr:uncharacterized protein LOC108127076 [Drosophila bipectinata]